MKLALLGATGRTGGLLLEGARKRNHQVRALARSAGALQAQEGLEVVEGSATSAEALERLLPGCDAVVSVLSGEVADEPEAMARELVVPWSIAPR